MKRWNDEINKRPSTHPEVCIRPRADVMQIKSHVKNYVGKKTVVQFICNVILKPIYSLSLQIAQKREPK
jgi:hypothetical protein